jgi:hypothetical protein
MDARAPLVVASLDRPFSRRIPLLQPGAVFASPTGMEREPAQGGNPHKK